MRRRRAIVESTAAGVAGILGAALYVPVLLGAAIRAIRRIGHCYGYPLATERDRFYVMGVLELATADEPEVRQNIRARLYLLMHDPKTAPLELHGVRQALAEDVAIEALPVLGEVAAVVLDYAFMRRVDDAARRVFQERWLRRRGKVLVIPPAEDGLRSQSLSVAWEASREVVYLGSFGMGFVATLPMAAAAAFLKRSLPGPAIRAQRTGPTMPSPRSIACAEGWRRCPVAHPAAGAVILTSPPGPIHAVAALQTSNSSAAPSDGAHRVPSGIRRPPHRFSAMMIAAILSARRAIVREGFTPSARGMIAPSATYRFRYPNTSPR